jgi:hypothetical protein
MKAVGVTCGGAVAQSDAPHSLLQPRLGRRVEMDPDVTLSARDQAGCHRTGSLAHPLLQAIKALCHCIHRAKIEYPLLRQRLPP